MVCWFGALSMMRGRVCRLQLLLALTSAVILGSVSLGTQDPTLLSQIWNSPFRHHLRLEGWRWRYSTPPPHGSLTSNEVTLRLTVSQSISVGVEPHLELMTRYLLLFDSYGLVFVGRPLWREDGSVFLYATGPCQRSLSRVRVPWDSRAYFTVSGLRLPFSSPLTTRRVTVEVLTCNGNWASLYNHGVTPQKTPLQTVILLLRSHLLGCPRDRY
jgi:hypothetical protein